MEFLSPVTFVELSMISACHNDVVKVVDLANKHDVVIIPFGGEFGFVLKYIAVSAISIFERILTLDRHVEMMIIIFWGLLSLN